MNTRNLASIGPDGILRPVWAQATPSTRHYFDTEWGRPIRSERGLFELIVLEVFVVGLSWALVLERREALARAFAGFDPDAVASFNEKKVEALLTDPTLIRNRRKIQAAITNAQATVALRELGGLVEFLWAFSPHAPLRPDIPATIPESHALAQALKEEGFHLVGPATMYALMQAAGIVNTKALFETPS